jgi:HK97 family phage prohead protease
MLTTIETRVSSTRAPELRTQSGSGIRQIVGYAAVFNREAVIASNFRERILPGAFRSAIVASDVRALFNHDPARVLGRTNNGTLRLTEDATGLRYEIDLNPDDPEATSLAAKIQRGDVSGSSFRFKVASDGQRIDAADRAGQLPLRSVTAFSEIIDVGPVTFPAYDETTSEVRDAIARLQPARRDVRAVLATIDATQQRSTDGHRRVMWDAQRALARLDAIRAARRPRPGVTDADRRRQLRDAQWLLPARSDRERVERLRAVRAERSPR